MPSHLHGVRMQLPASVKQGLGKEELMCILYMSVLCWLAMQLDCTSRSRIRRYSWKAQNKTNVVTSEAMNLCMCSCRQVEMNAKHNEFRNFMLKGKLDKWESSELEFLCSPAQLGKLACRLSSGWVVYSVILAAGLIFLCFSLGLGLGR